MPRRLQESSGDLPELVRPGDVSCTPRQSGGLGLTLEAEAYALPAETRAAIIALALEQFVSPGEVARRFGVDVELVWILIQDDAAANWSGF